MDVIRRMTAANVRVMRCAISSPLTKAMKKRTRSRLRRNLVRDSGGSCGHFDSVTGYWISEIAFSFLGDNVFGKLRVGQTFVVLLAVGEHPLQEVFDGVALGGVLKFARESAAR